MTALTVKDLNPALGTEVSGLEPNQPLDEETIRVLRDLFDKRGALVFRNLDTDESFQRYLVYTLIGEEPPATAGPDVDGEPPPSFFVSNREDAGGAPYGRLLYHCDAMWAEHPQPVISLYGVQVEQPTVPTMFINMGYGWDTLPEHLRTRVEGLQARHGFDHSYPNRGGDENVIDSYYEQPHSTVTPVVHHHPRTGRTLLYVSQQATIEILGLSQEDNEETLEALFDHLYNSPGVVRHEWQEGDLVVWDNRLLQHARGTVDLEGPARTLRKVVGPMFLSEAERVRPTFSKVSGT